MPKAGVPANNCPRCERLVSWTKDGRPYKHRTLKGEECSGEPKSILDLVGDILDNIADERMIITAFLQAQANHSHAILELHRALSESSTRTSANINKAVKELERLQTEAKAKLKAAKKKK